MNDSSFGPAIMTSNVGSRDNVKEHECGTKFCGECVDDAQIMPAPSVVFTPCAASASRSGKMFAYSITNCNMTKPATSRTGDLRNATMTRRDPHRKLLVVVCTWQVHDERLCEEAEAVITAMLCPFYMTRGGPHISRCSSGHQSARCRCLKSRR